MGAEQPCETYRDTLALIAIGEGAEGSQAVAEHVGQCPGCRSYLNLLGRAVDTLAEEVPQVTPPAFLKGKVMRRTLEEQAPSPSDGGRGGAPSALSPSGMPPSAEGRRAALARRSGRPAWGTILPWTAAALLAILLWTGGDGDSPPGELHELQAGLRALESRLTELESRRRADADGDARRSPTAVALSSGGPDGSGGEAARSPAAGMAMVFPSGEGFYLYLVAQHLAPLPGDEVYRVWLRDGGARTSIGTLQANAGGRGELIYWGASPFSFDGIGVTRESDGAGEGLQGTTVLEASFAG